MRTHQIETGTLLNGAVLAEAVYTNMPAFHDSACGVNQALYISDEQIQKFPYASTPHSPCCLGGWQDCPPALCRASLTNFCRIFCREEPGPCRGIVLPIPRSTLLLRMREKMLRLFLASVPAPAQDLLTERASSATASRSKQAITCSCSQIISIVASDGRHFRHPVTHSTSRPLCCVVPFMQRVETA